MRKIFDPFGLSILDILSNALGATIILMLIVSVATHGDVKDKNIRSFSERGGTEITVDNSADIRPINPDSLLYTIEIKIFDFKDTITIEEKRGKSCWEYYRTDTYDHSLNDTWLVKQVKEFTGEDQLTIRLKNSIELETSIQVTIFKGNAFIRNHLPDKKIEKKEMTFKVLFQDVFGHVYSGLK